MKNELTALEYNNLTKEDKLLYAEVWQWLNCSESLWEDEASELSVTFSREHNLETRQIFRLKPTPVKESVEDETQWLTFEDILDKNISGNIVKIGEELFFSEADIYRSFKEWQKSQDKSGFKKEVLQILEAEAKEHRENSDFVRQGAITNAISKIKEL